VGKGQKKIKIKYCNLICTKGHTKTSTVRNWHKTKIKRSFFSSHPFLLSLYKQNVQIHTTREKFADSLLRHHLFYFPFIFSLSLSPQSEREGLLSYQKEPAFSATSLLISGTSVGCLHFLLLMLML
jgi:hypothetical protein